MSYQARYLVSHFSDMQTQARELLEEYRGLEQEIAQGEEKITKQLNEALSELSKNYVAELSASAFE